MTFVITRGKASLVALEIHKCSYGRFWCLLISVSPQDVNMLMKYVLVFILGLELCTACDMDQTKQGCRIQNKACSCGFGCISEYRYDTMAECQTALRGKRRDICNPNPCLHSGSCIQISQRPKYKCRCEGTGYFGLRCSRACPTPGGSSDLVFPYECIVI